MTYLKAGMKGDPVRELQAHLKVLCHYTGDPHGEFDDATANALKALQTELELGPSGELDKATELELDTHLALLRGALRCLGFLRDEEKGHGSPSPRV